MVIYTSSLHRLTWPVYFRGNAPSVSPERSPSSWNASAKWPQCSSNTQACYAERTERKSLQWMLEKQYSGKENISNGLWSATVELKFDARWPFSGVIQLPSAQRCQWGISSLTDIVMLGSGQWQPVTHSLRYPFYPPVCQGKIFSSLYSP